MPTYIHSCPNCGRDKNDIGWSASYFDVYECENCGQRYCHACPSSNGGRHCPNCQSTDREVYGRVSKP
ncbi:hypothetical protein HUU05_00790 [candidate division KSB1 bacterium]|nr:hypothetical protein [candidate division KSB1 bacterium]